MPYSISDFGFNSVNSPCGRDLVREMAAQCERKGLGFFAYYTFMLNWKHPHGRIPELVYVKRPREISTRCFDAGQRFREGLKTRVGSKIGLAA